MKIGIHFPDNDFWRTVTCFLAEIQAGVENVHCSGKPLEERLTKERVVYTFNTSANALYLIRQNGFCYDLHSKDALVKYLQISESQVYLNEEVDSKIQDDDSDSDFHYLDTETGLIKTT